MESPLWWLFGNYDKCGVSVTKPQCFQYKVKIVKINEQKLRITPPFFPFFQISHTTEKRKQKQKQTNKTKQKLHGIKLSFQFVAMFFFSRNKYKDLSFISFFRFSIQFPVHVKAWRALKNSPKFYFFRPAFLWHELKIILYLKNYLD